MPIRIHIFILLLFVTGTAVSQQPLDSLSNLRYKRVLVSSDTLRLDSLSIVPRSVQIAELRTGEFHVDYNNGIIFFKEKPVDSLSIFYRVFPFKSNVMVQRFNYDSIRFNFTAETPYYLKGDTQGDKLLDFGDMNYYGSFGRGISFGNNQDAVVNSTLNLQINGFIGDSVEFTAAISDNNIPIQPDGNTQNIQDFDRIFMQVKKRGWQLNFGDIDIRQGNNRYLNFYKRLQGGSFITENGFKNGNKNSFTASGAVAKGKFTRNVITPQEGNQGPYKLYGGNNEIYFAVLAGTERIYIDGVLLERGEDRDYVIDYNMAELTFTAKRLITKDSRIQAEFEYTDRNYLNSMLYAKNDFQVKDKWQFSVGAYSNVDAKNSSINQTLSSQQKYFLSTIGNDIQNALYPSGYIDTFSVNRILYKKTDTTYNGVTDTIYVYSFDKNDTLYNLSFTNVGAGKGNYVATAGNANGRVFEWVAPEDGQPRGDWEPVTFLITPKKHQVFSGSAAYVVNKNTQMKITGAFSDYDPNTFSTVNNGENKGAALRMDFDNQKYLKKTDKKELKLKSHFDYEYVNERFKSIETLRGVEFYRDWGLEILNPPADENLLNVQLAIESQSQNFIRYGFSNYRRNSDYSGIRNTVESVIDKNGWRFDNKIYLTNVNSGIFKGTFFRPYLSMSRTFKKISNYQAGVSFSSENNKTLIKTYDTLSPVSFAFNIWQVFIKSDPAKPSKWGISYQSRENFLPIGRLLKQTDRSDNFSVNTELLSSDKRQLRLNATYRQLHANEAFGKDINLKDDESLLGRADYAFEEWNGLLNGTVFYELGAGQEQKRQFTYIEVPAGQGYYMWVDYNGDGVPQLDEFEIAVFQDQKRWVRILTPTNEFLKANYIQFNYNVSINPQRIKTTQETSFLKFLKRFSTTSSLQINKKEVSQGRFLFNPFSKPFSDIALISLSSYLSNSIYFNRTNPVWGIDLTHRVNSNKAVLSYGFESNRIRDMGSKLRINLTKTINTTLNTHLKKRILSVPAFVQRNYNVDEFNMEPSLSYTYKTDFRASVFYAFEQKKNTIGSKETSKNNALKGEVRYNIFSSGVLNARMELNRISFTGNPASPVGFILLDGLQPGKNVLWNIELTKRLPGNIELNLQYEGRKSAATPTIHTGRASLRAIL